MKKELMASVLTFTAGMASTVAFPQYALAKSAIVESAFAKSFRLKSAHKVRYTDDKGQQILGHIYMDLEQEKTTPSYSNRLHGEMTGYFYFESDDATSSYEGREFKTVVAVTGDDGEVLLDMTHAEQGSEARRTYQIYGCNSTRTQCQGDSFEIEFYNNKKASLSLHFAADSKLEYQEFYTGQEPYWTKFSPSAEMFAVPVEK